VSLPMKKKITIAAFSVLLILCAAVSAADDAAREPVEVRLLPNKEYVSVLLETIERAESDIVIAVYLFKTNGYRSNYPDRIVAALGDAVQRGVEVRVLLEKTGDADSFIDRANAETAERLQKVGVDVVFDPPSRRTHVKMVVADREITFVGSHNFTNSGLKYNNETSIMVVSPDTALKALDYIDGIGR
jgi:phosphatidylserine/phosphatidylglycerophosphate/cardiolipin synthase-like enzyme